MPCQYMPVHAYGRSYSVQFCHAAGAAPAARQTPASAGIWSTCCTRVMRCAYAFVSAPTLPP